MYLNTHTYYSLRYGTIKPRDLLQWFQDLGVSAFALTDINTTSACLEIARLSPKYNIKPSLGIDFRNSAKQQFILLARNNEGFQHINHYLSEFLHEDDYKIPDRAKALPNTFVIYPFTKFEGETLLDHEFLGVKIEDINRLKFSPWNKRLDKLVI
ncbi:MAG: PHP domain-containing protein, partial [Flavobacteriaceae bacterium]|nr:PHP domain-containing protein [Flavobacteriaceae bacterium]